MEEGRAYKCMGVHARFPLQPSIRQISGLILS